MNLILTGASGTGKSTLARLASERFGVRLAESQTSRIAETFGGFSVINQDPEIRGQFQAAVRRNTYETLAGLVADGEPFILDRFLDNYIYQALYSDEALDLEEARGLTLLAPPDGTRALLLRPVAWINKVALANDNGRRGFFLDWQAVLRFDSGLEVLMKLLRVPYTSCDAVEMKQRLELVGKLTGWGS
jgi:thymidylate kinase